LITYKDIYLAEIELIHNLWLLNSEFHLSKSIYFSKLREKDKFKERIESWKTKGSIRITIALEKEIVGYCVSSIDNDIGIIESLYVLESERRKGIGKELIKRHIEWLKEKGSKKIEVTTVYGNDDSLDFYRSVNMFPKTVKFELRKE
jgi:GNAT superfamily N-acetyltransferase